MQITLEVPDHVGRALDTPQFRTALLENMAIEGYRAKRLSEAQVRRMLGFSSRFDDRCRGHVTAELPFADRRD